VSEEFLYPTNEGRNAADCWLWRHMSWSGLFTHVASFNVNTIPLKGQTRSSLICVIVEVCSGRVWGLFCVSSSWSWEPTTWLHLLTRWLPHQTQFVRTLEHLWLFVVS